MHRCEANNSRIARAQNGALTALDSAEQTTTVGRIATFFERIPLISMLQNNYV